MLRSKLYISYFALDHQHVKKMSCEKKVMPNVCGKTWLNISWSILIGPVGNCAPAVHWMTASNNMDHKSIEKLAPMLFNLVPMVRNKMSVLFVYMAIVMLKRYMMVNIL